MDNALAIRVLALRDRIVAHFNAGDWEAAGLLTGHGPIINTHPRLLRSLSWGDEDYAGSVLTVLRCIAEEDPSALDKFDSLLDRQYPEESHFVSAKPSPKRLTFAPHVFQVPESMTVERDLPSRVESRRGAVVVGSGSCRCRRLSPDCRCLIPIRDSVSTSRSSNRTGGFPASGSRTRSHAFAHGRRRVSTGSRTSPSVSVRCRSGYRE